jgi:hypothetical protein
MTFPALRAVAFHAAKSTERCYFGVKQLDNRFSRPALNNGSLRAALATPDANFTAISAAGRIENISHPTMPHSSKTHW